MKLKGTNKLGVVESVITDFEQVNWDNNRPNFIVVKFDDDTYTVTPSHLKVGT